MRVATPPARRRRSLRTACAALLALAAPALAGTPERDSAWRTLIAQAKAHGGMETKRDRSVSLVFQRPDGSFLTLTRLTKPAKGRSVCLVAKDQNATACVDWDSGKLTLGDRADAATPWRFHGAESLDAFEAAQPGVLQRLFSTIENFAHIGGGTRGSRGGAGGYWRYRNGNMYWINTKN